MYLIENGLYKQEVNEQNFYKLGMNKIIGSSNEKLLKDEELLKYSIGIALRKNNENPYEVNLPFNQDIKRVIGIPIFSISDEDLFHELNHAVCSQHIETSNREIIKCGLFYSNTKASYIYEIINDLISLEIYDIFKSKCPETIFDDNIMSEVLIYNYQQYHSIVIDFYNKNKEQIKISSIENTPMQINEIEFKKLIQKVKK